MSAELRNVTLAANDMAREIEQLKAERDRYRLAWKSARERAQSSSETILRVVSDRESYQGWLKQEQAAMQALRAQVTELEADSATLAALEAGGVDNWEGYSDALAEVLS